jgi:hypothetical protein
LGKPIVLLNALISSNLFMRSTLHIFACDGLGVEIASRIDLFGQLCQEISKLYLK